MNINGQKCGARLIAEERLRQKTVEGYDDKHDDGESDDALIRGATAYLLHEHCDRGANQAAFDMWPDEWDISSFKAGPERIRNLTKAGAMIAAAIDRELRAKSKV